MTQRELALSWLQTYSIYGGWLTATELSRLTGHKLSSLSSLLKKMCDEGDVIRKKGLGLRGGYGYRVVKVPKLVITYEDDKCSHVEYKSTQEFHEDNERFAQEYANISFSELCDLVKQGEFDGTILEAETHLRAFLSNIDL